MMALEELPKYAQKAYSRLGSGQRLIRTSSDSEEASTGGGFLYSVDPGGPEIPDSQRQATGRKRPSLPRRGRAVTRSLADVRTRLMPTVLRRSGHDITRDGKPVTPRAMIHFCEDCGYEGASFGKRVGHRLLSYCGWAEGEPICINKGDQVAPKIWDVCGGGAESLRRVARPHYGQADEIDRDD